MHPPSRTYCLPCLCVSARTHAHTLSHSYNQDGHQHIQPSLLPERVSGGGGPSMARGSEFVVGPPPGFGNAFPNAGNGGRNGGPQFPEPPPFGGNFMKGGNFMNGRSHFENGGFSVRSLENQRGNFKNKLKVTIEWLSLSLVCVCARSLVLYGRWLICSRTWKIQQ